jgi:hypothetical protein
MTFVTYFRSTPAMFSVLKASCDFATWLTQPCFRRFGSLRARSCCAAGGKHLGKGLLDRPQQVADVLGEDAPDRADAEAVGAGHLAGVDHEPEVVQPGVIRRKADP